MVAGALERRVWIKTRSKLTYPNLYILLVSPPGGGKGIISDVREFWRETIDPDTKDAKCFHVAPDSVTKASLIDEIDDAETIRLKGFSNGHFKYQSLLVAAEEFEVLLPHYDPEFIGVLNAMFNNQEQYSERRRTGNRKVVELTRPQLNILGGVQPAYFVAHFPHYAWDTGLSRRAIMIYSEPGPPTSLLGESSNTPALAKHILKRLSYIFDKYEEAKFGAGVLDALEAWHMQNGPPTPEHSRLQNYNKSRTEFVTKLSVISAVSRTNETIVHELDLRRAIGWLTEAEQKMPDVFRAMKLPSDELVLENLHQVIQREYVRTGKKPVPVQAIINWLSHTVTAERVFRMIDLAFATGAIEPHNGDKEFWIPRPKHLRGVE